MKTSIIIPTRNEEGTIAEIVAGCLPHGDEVLVVDGSSRDRTASIAREAGARVMEDNGRGKGAALRLAFREASGDIAVTIDADGSHSPADIPALVRPILEGKADLVVGSRMAGGSDELHGDLPKFVRLIGSEIITLAINYRFGVRLTDTQNGLRAVRREAVLSAGLAEDIFTIEQEMIMKMLKRGFRVAEVPAHEYARRHGFSNINVATMGWRYVWCLLKNLV